MTSLQDKPNQDETLEVEKYKDHFISFKLNKLPRVEDCFQKYSEELKKLEESGIDVSIVAPMLKFDVA